MSDSTLEAIFNFIPISDAIATAGQPTPEQVAAIKQAGYDVIINLALPTSTNALPNEQDIVESHHMEYIHIPVVWENPTLADLQQFFAAIESHSDQKILVHCAMNMRVSAFIYLYQRICQQMNDADAKKALNQIWTPNEIWQAFIDNAIATLQLPL